jgi:hypothetical protein
MKVTTCEAIVEGGQVRLPADAHIPDHTRVFVVVPSSETPGHAHLSSPRLAHPEQAVAFAKEVEEEPDDAQL